MTNPCALFTSCCKNFAPNELIKRIKGKNVLEDGINDLENIWRYDWHIDTKYYTADIQLCCTTGRTIGNKEFSELVQAVIIYFDPQQESTFEKAKSWMPYLNALSPPIQILVCETCSEENDVKRSIVQKWCIANEFELVELSPQQQDDDEDDDFAETTGIKRIIQALHAHTWSNLRMKENPSIHSPYMRKLMEEEKSCNESDQTDNVNNESDQTENVNNESDQTENVNNEQLDLTGACKRLNDADDTESEKQDDKKSKEKKSESEKIDELLPQNDDTALFDAVGEDDPGGSFESLFAKFSLMKEKAESLPPEQRKEYAEQVAVSFWKALGGEEDEIDSLNSSGDEICEFHN